MRWLIAVMFVAFTVPCAASGAQADRAVSKSVGPEKVLCARNPSLCKPFRDSISFPAHALSRSTFGNFALHTRGVDWTGEQGAMSFTMHRPKGYVTGKQVRLRLAYDIPGDGDLASIGFAITPTSFNHGSGFETYGGESTGLIQAGSGTIHEQSVTFSFPGAYSLGGDWWYFEIDRVGDFAGKLRLMSVAVEY